MALAVGPHVAQFKRRFHAWWDGFEYVEAAEGEAADGAVAETATAAQAARATDDRWSPQRVRVAELIWGDGFNFPGGADAALDLVKPFNLNQNKTLLDFGCGLGGGARVIAKTLGAWVEGLEPSATLAAEAIKAVGKSGLGKKVSIQAFDPAAGKLPNKRYDAIFGRQVLGLVKDKTALITGLNNCLKPGGHIMIIEYALAAADADGPELRAWREAEDPGLAPPTIELIAGALKHEKINVRVAEDFAPNFKAQVLAGWARLAEEIKGKSVSAEEKPLLARELDLWAKRIAAFDSGSLKLARVHGIKKG